MLIEKAQRKTASQIEDSEKRIIFALNNSVNSPMPKEFMLSLCAFVTDWQPSDSEIAKREKMIELIRSLYNADNAHRILAADAEVAEAVQSVIRGSQSS